jgi:F-type H+-transporting ATPase subunit c
MGMMLLAAPLAMAQEAAAGLGENVKLGVALASGLTIGIAALGGALAQGRATAAGLEGIARNPGASGKIMTPMIIGLAMIESLVIYALVIAFMLYFKL